jgi:hypothetical protein
MAEAVYTPEKVETVRTVVAPAKVTLTLTEEEAVYVLGVIGTSNPGYCGCLGVDVYADLFAALNGNGDIYGAPNDAVKRSYKVADRHRAYLQGT